MTTGTTCWGHKRRPSRLVPTDMGMQLANDIVAAGLAPDAGAAVASVVEQTPLGRLGEVGDMADAAFSFSNQARFITGAVTIPERLPI